MGPREIKKHCELDAPFLALLEKAVEKLGLSARAYHRILKIGRTIADLDHSDTIRTEHLAEAIKAPRSKLRGIFDCKEVILQLDSLAFPAANYGECAHCSIQYRRLEQKQ